MRPRPAILYLIGIWLLLSILASWAPEPLGGAWLVVTVLILGLASVDGFLLPRRSPVTVKRRLQGRFALGQEDEVALDVIHQQGGRRTIQLFDEIPSCSRSETMPWTVQVVPDKTTKMTYRLTFFERGEVSFGRTQVLVKSPLGLWARRFFLGKEQISKVYPNYEPVIRFALLSMDNRIEQMGIVSKSRIGISREFHQLRDYHEGDTISQIDWKATSRRCQLIAKDYQEQRDQTVIFMVDKGRRMRAVDGEFTQFDQGLNAMLLLAYVALRQGDHVGIMGFGGEPSWLAPVKGGHSMSTVLNHLYGFQTSPEPSDFEEAVRQLLVRQKRRALVVLLTNLRGEDKTELVKPLSLLRTKHLVSVGSLREESVNDLLEKPIRTADEALGYGAAQMYLEERAKVRQVLKDHGIPSVDETAKNFPIALANHYLEIKSSGLL